MKNTEPTNAENYSAPYYIRFETDAEGIRQYKSAPDIEKQGTCLGKMRSEGILVPAILLEVDKETYERHQREVWKADEYAGNPETPKTMVNDCENCPYGNHHFFSPVKGNVVFSALEANDEAGNSDPFEPESISDPLSADRYFELLEGLISYIKENYPKYSKYAEFVYLLGQEYEIKEVATIMKKSGKTLYSWRKKLRPIVDEYLQSVDS